MGKKTVLIIICIFIFLFIIINAFSWYMPWNKNKAANIAIDYLKDKYSEPMNYLKVRIPFIDPVIYHVYFSSINNTSLEFEVMVNTDFTLPKCPDNYLLEYFSLNLSKGLHEKIGGIWEEDVKTQIIINNQPLYSFNAANELDEHMGIKEMAAFIDYDLFLTIDEDWEDADRSAESFKIYQLIQKIKADNYSPKMIRIFYQSVGSKKRTLRFGSWEKIETASQVEDIINSEL